MYRHITPKIKQGVQKSNGLPLIKQKGGLRDLKEPDQYSNSNASGEFTPKIITNTRPNNKNSIPNKPETGNKQLGKLFQPTSTGLAGKNVAHKIMGAQVPTHLKDKYNEYYDETKNYKQHRNKNETSDSIDSFQSQDANRAKKKIYPKEGDSKSTFSEQNSKTVKMIEAKRAKLNDEAGSTGKVIPSKSKGSLEQKAVQDGARKINPTAKQDGSLRSNKGGFTPRSPNPTSPNPQEKKGTFFRQASNPDNNAKFLGKGPSSPTNQKFPYGGNPTVKNKVTVDKNLGSKSPAEKTKVPAMKSTPYLNKKMAIDSDCSIEEAKEMVKKFVGNKKKLDTSQDTKIKNQSSFNKRQEFKRLKQKQQKHQQFKKELDELQCYRDKFQVKMLSLSSEKSDKESTESKQPITFAVLKKIVEHKSISIYVCRHIDSNTVYCMKKMTSQRNETQLNNLIRQWKIQQYLSHPNIIQNYGLCSDQHHNHYMLLQYAQGGNLKDYLRGQVMKCSQSTLISDSLTSKLTKMARIRQILEELLLAICYLHDNQIIHRDLKPQNILLTHDSIKIADFGSSTHNNSQQYVGTLDYVAPEILEHQPYTRSIDMWSVGCIAYELDVGRPPFYNINQEETMRLIRDVECDMSLISHDGLRGFVGRLLRRENGSGSGKAGKRMTAQEAIKSQFLCDKAGN